MDILGPPQIELCMMRPSVLQVKQEETLQDVLLRQHICIKTSNGLSAK